MRLLMLPLLLAACTGAPDPDPSGAVPDRTPAETTDVTVPDSVVAVTGVVRHFDLEGGFFAIRGDDGTTYDPSNLDEEFRQDGLRVHARVRLRPDMGGIHMVGPIVDIIEIRKDSVAAEPAPDR
jgi:inhibitor of cysteine peptidase